MAQTQQKQHFTKYEIARIIGARALQIAMDAPLLLTVSDEQLKSLRYDALKIAELELNEGVLPITVHRPMPLNRSEKLEVKEEQVSDEALIAKAQEEEKEIVEDAAEIGLVNEAEVEEEPEEAATEEQ